MTLSRRVVLSAGALVVAFAWRPGGAHGATPGGLPGSLRLAPHLDSWIRVDRDGRITVLTGKAELGQGIGTALIQVAAEELDVPPETVRLITADTGRTANEGITAGSLSMQESGAAILNAAANVRLMLAQEAARRFGVAPDAVTTGGDGRMIAGGQSVGYGELAAGLSLHVEARPDVLRRGGRRRTLGTALPRVDIPAKLSGAAAYVQDLRLPGMLHARVVRARSEGSGLIPAEADAVAAMPGVVKLVRNGRFTAVIAEHEWTAIQALRRLQEGVQARVVPPPAADPLAALQQAASQDSVLFERAASARPAGRRVRARYTRPWLLHGAIGPSCAIARLEAGALTVWTHSQGVYPLRTALAELVGLAPDKIRCIHVEGSGCYGHNGADDVAADAALAAMAVPGRPVRLQWMREQEHGWEPLGAGMVVEADAELDASGRIALWRYEVWSPPHNTRPATAGGLLAGREVEPAFAPQTPRPIPMPPGGGDRNAVPLYDVPAGRIVSHFLMDSPVRVSALRSLGAHMNVFAVESLMDELAGAAGADPVAFRLAHLADPRARAVITSCAERFGWAKRRSRVGHRGCGFAFARYKNLAAYCAMAMEVSLERETGLVHVRRVLATIDAGEAVNPDGVRNQVEGAIVQSLSWTAMEAFPFGPEGRSAPDWSAYPIARFRDLPDRVEVHVIDRPGEPFLGTGEAGQGPAAAAFANAIADAAGVRLRDMPLTSQRLKAALASTTG